MGRGLAFLDEFLDRCCPVAPSIGFAHCLQGSFYVADLAKVKAASGPAFLHIDAAGELAEDGLDVWGNHASLTIGGGQRFCC